MRLLGHTAFFLLFCALGTAQLPYGSGTPGAGGFVPVLTSNQAWMGNTGFAMNITHGLGGASGILAISHQPAFVLAGGTQILVSLAPGDLVQLSPITLSGMPGAPGAGSATINLPLTGPVTPALAGTSFYAQVGIADYSAPMAFAASAGLRVTLTMPPLVVATTTAAFLTGTHFVDPLTMTLAYPSHYVTADTSTTGMAFAHGGRDLLIGRADGHRIDRVDLSSGAPAWSVFHSSPWPCVGVAVDQLRDRVYTHAFQYDSSVLVAIDGNPANPSFGLPLASSAPFPHWSAWCLSPSGNRAAIVAPADQNCPQSGQSLFVWILEMDPQSPNYLQPVATTAVPPQVCPGGANPQPTKVAFAQDDQYVFVLTSALNCYALAAAGVGRFHIPSGTWTDFNPAVPGTQLINGTSQPPVQFHPTTRDFGVAADGTFGFALGVDGLITMQFDASLPSGFAATVTGSPQTGCFGFARGVLSPDEASVIAVETLPAGAVVAARVDLATLTAPAWVVLGPYPYANVESVAIR